MLQKNEHISQASLQGSFLTHNQSDSLQTGPTWLRTTIACVEALLVIAVGYFCASIITQFQTDASWQPPLVRGNVVGANAGVAKGSLKSIEFDPFYRLVSQPTIVNRAAPESSMKITIFGLRSDGQGGGSAIVKAGSDRQKLVQVGNAIKAGVSLAGVYSDRIEISRSGIRETVYMRPASERKVSKNKPYRIASPKTAQSLNADELTTLITGLDLMPVRLAGRISGFQVGKNAKSNSLSISGLKLDDILLSVNDIKLTSFERIAELAEELQGVSSFTVFYERLGEERTQNIALK